MKIKGKAKAKVERKRVKLELERHLNRTRTTDSGVNSPLMGRWDELPADLLNIIGDNLLYYDKVRSRCVCTHWKSTTPELPAARQQLPYLLLPYADRSLCGLYHPFESKVFQINLPEAGEKVFKGSGHGWVVTVQQDGSIDLFNLLSRVQFGLPPRDKFPDVEEYCPENRGEEYRLKSRYCIRTLDSMDVRDHSIYKIALSCKPSSSNFRAVALYVDQYRLAYCKIGDKKWYDLEECDGIRRDYQDITFCGRKLYALTHGELMVCDDIVSCPKLKSCIPAQNLAREIYSRLHLINSSSGGIMAVARVEEPRPEDETKFKTVDFEVFKLDVSSSSWIQVKSLGSEILFMGLGKQFGIRGMEGDQIYFSSDKFDCSESFDNGIFNLGDKTIKPLGHKANPDQLTILSPIWVMLNPN